VLADRSRRGRRFHPGPASRFGELVLTLKLVVHWVHRITRDPRLALETAPQTGHFPSRTSACAVMLYRPADEYTSYVLNANMQSTAGARARLIDSDWMTPTSGKLHQLETKMTKPPRRQGRQGSQEAINQLWRTLSLGALGGWSLRSHATTIQGRSLRIRPGLT